jgi:hypothetical protein
LARGRLSGRAAENHLVHGAEDDTPAVHDNYPPDTLALFYALKAI